MSEAISESVEMYLLRIALLGEDGQPVPISALADELSVSPVSANQMCRRLEERGMLVYQPYRGVTLTPPGEAVAMGVLRKRRLWEVFLADRLGIEPVAAEEMACRFEHVTPDLLAERLSDFLGDPALSPQREPIPSRVGDAVGRPRRALNTLLAGQRGQVSDVDGDPATHEFLRGQGISRGIVVDVLAVGEHGEMLISTGEASLSLAPQLAALVTINLVAVA